MKPILIFVLLLGMTVSLKAQYHLETTFYVYKDSQFVSNSKRSLFDSDDIYDKKNRLVEKKYLGAVTSGTSVKFEYNDKDQKIAEKHFDVTGAVRTTKYYVYNDSGKVKEINMDWVEKGGEKRSSKEEFFYNNQNELIHKTYTTSKNGLESEWFFEVSKVNGNKVVTTKHLIKGVEQKPIEVVYNDKDLVIQEGSLTYTYEYDDKGEWITKRMLRKGQIVGEYRRVRRNN